MLTGSAAINGTGNSLANTWSATRARTRSTAATATTSSPAALGKDKLLGKGGKDIFVFADALTEANADKIKGFKHKKDKIFLDQDIFAAVGPKVSKKEYFEGKKAHDKNDHIIKKGNKLYYDDDGKGGDSRCCSPRSTRRRSRPQRLQSAIRHLNRRRRRAGRAAGRRLTFQAAADIRDRPGGAGLARGPNPSVTVP